jgi:hypothetical protein
VRQRAHDLDLVLEGARASLGAGTRSLSVTAMQTWRLIRIGVATDDQLFALADDLGLDPARTVRRGRIWFRQAEAKENWLVVIAAGPDHEGVPP